MTRAREADFGDVYYAELGRQWIRKAQLLIAKRPTYTPYFAGGPQKTTTEALDLTEFRFTFEISTNDLETPNNMTARVYNLDPETMKMIVEEYDQVSLSAGYKNALYGIIFTGTIRWFQFGKENQTDSFLEITAGDNDIGYNFGFVNTTLSYDAQIDTWKKVYDECVAAFGVQPDDDTVDFLLLEGGVVMPRGRVLFAPARVLMHELSESLRARWSVINGKLVVMQDKTVRKNAATLLNADTGLIGTPTLTDQGVEVRCLLNPALVIGGVVQIQSELIVTTKLVTSMARDSTWLGYRQPVFTAKISPINHYRILQIDYTGDTRGNDWYCDLICSALDPAAVKELKDGTA